MSDQDYKTREGEPAHLEVMRVAWQQFVAARREFGDVWRRSRRGRGLGRACDCVHSHGRMVQASVLVDELVDLYLQNDWPVPVEIQIERLDLAAEGQ